MTTEQKMNLMTVTAAQDLTVADAMYHAVTLAGTIAANTSRVGGVLRYKATSGQQASVIYQGVAKVMAGGAVSTLGYPLTVTASGWFIAASSGGAAVGRALAVAASGDLIPAHVDFQNVAPWPGV
jgi:hypothetical protein